MDFGLKKFNLFLQSAMDSGTKVLFFDIDGTIMTFSYTIPESTVCAIQRARAMVFLVISGVAEA